MKKPKRDSGN